MTPINKGYPVDMRDVNALLIDRYGLKRIKKIYYIKCQNVWHFVKGNDGGDRYRVFDTVLEWEYVK